MEFSVLKDCCKRHLIAPTGLEPVYSIAVRNTSVIAVMFPPVCHNRQSGHRRGAESNPRLFGYKPKALPLSYVPLCVSISRMPAFKALTQRNTYGYFYFRRASASYLLVGRYPTSWGREELNLHCLPHRNGFTVSCNTANRCRFPKVHGQPHSISLHATVLRIQYQISSAPLEHQESNPGLSGYKPEALPLSYVPRLHMPAQRTYAFLQLYT